MEEEAAAENTPTTNPPSLEATAGEAQPAPSDSAEAMPDKDATAGKATSNQSSIPTEDLGFKENDLGIEQAPVQESTPAAPVPETIPEAAPVDNGTNGSNGGIRELREVRESPLRPLNAQTAKELSIKAHRVKQEKKRQRLERIMSMFNRPTSPPPSHKATEGQRRLRGVKAISNNEVQLLLGVSNSTATRYLRELVKQGRVSREGKGRFIIYRKI